MTSDMEPSSTNPPLSANDGLSPAVRWIASAVIAFHVFAVFITPFHVSTLARTGSNSPASGPVRLFIEPYTRFMYVSHGYAFFAPDPGPAHLIHYEVRFADGRKESGKLPDLDKHWPRLLYHRHFMIAEAYHNSYASPDEPQLIPALPDGAPPRDKREYRRAKDNLPTVIAEWKARRRVYEKFRNSLTDHIRSLYEAEGEIEEIKLTRVEHLLLSPDDIRERVDGEANEYYDSLSETPDREPLPWNRATPSPKNK